MRQTFFKCLIRLDEKTALVVDYVTTDKATPESLPEAVNYLFVTLVYTKQGKWPEDTVAIRWRVGDTNEHIEQLNLPDRLKDALIKFVTNWKKDDLYLRGLSDSDYMRMKKELFDLLSIADIFAKSSLPDTEYLKIYYRPIANPADSDAHFVVSYAEAANFIRTGVL